jgi:hypothetical protein
MFVRMANRGRPHGPSSDQLNQKTSLVTTSVCTPLVRQHPCWFRVHFFVALAVQRDALMVTFFIGAITNGVL